MSFSLLERPLYQIGGNYVSFLGLIAFTALLTAGLISARALQSGIVRRFFSRFKIDNKLIAVFWISSRTKRFLFNRFLVHSGLDRALQYAISQIVSNVVLVVGIFIVLVNTGINLDE